MAGLPNAELFVEWKTGLFMALADTNSSDFQGAGASSSKGLVPDPGNSGTTNRFLNETGVWRQITASDISGLSAYAPVAVPIINGYFTVSVSSSAATLYVLNTSGSVPTTASPVLFVFKNNTANNGAFSVYTLDTSMNATIPSGATLGVTAAQAFRLWVTAVASATSSPVMGVIYCKSGINIYPLSLVAQSTVGSTLLTSASDSAQVVYTASASVSSGIANILGYIGWEAGLVTPGEWSVAPTDVMQARVGMPFPGMCINQFGTQTGAALSASTSIPFDNTIPDITEGTEFITCTGVFSSRANLVEIQGQAFFGVSTSTSGNMALALFQDAVSAAIAVSSNLRQGQPRVEDGSTMYRQAGPVPQNISFWVGVNVNRNTSTTYRLRAGIGASVGAVTASNIAFALNAGVSNTASAGTQAFFGGTYNSFIRAREFMT